MTTRQIQTIEEVLNLLPYVTWDRFTEDEDSCNIYGWIERRDQYKDFVLLHFTLDYDYMPYWFVTSSAVYSAKIFEDLRCAGEHEDCKRVEHVFRGARAVNL